MELRKLVRARALAPRCTLASANRNSRISEPQQHGLVQYSPIGWQEYDVNWHRDCAYPLTRAGILMCISYSTARRSHSHSQLAIAIAIATAIAGAEAVSK